MKMFNIMRYQGNKTIINYYHKFLRVANTKSSYAGEDVEKLGHSHISSGHVTPYNHAVQQCSCFSKNLTVNSGTLCGYIKFLSEVTVSAGGGVSYPLPTPCRLGFCLDWSCTGREHIITIPVRLYIQLPCCIQKILFSWSWPLPLALKNFLPSLRQSPWALVGGGHTYVPT